MDQVFSLMLIDDERSVLSSIRRLLHREPYRILTHSSGKEALAEMQRTPVDLVVLDLRMPGMNGFEVLEQIQTQPQPPRVIIFTADGGIAEAVEGMRLGAVDFLEKTAAPNVVRHRIARQYEVWKLEQENQTLKQQLAHPFSFEAMIGEAPAMTRLKDLIARVAPTDTTVLIQGESGTGKELVARAIHHHGPRRNKPLVVVDCASLSEQLFESELFGHVRGAFTGAEAAKTGLIRAAEGGTLFFDELGELPLNMQAKLLRTLQERQVRPVGMETAQAVDVRVVAATNRDLLAYVQEGKFRADLYYRLSAVTLGTPPLRERREDIPLIAQSILDQLNQASNRTVVFADNVPSQMQRFQWPGNVRELENTVRGAHTFCRDEQIQMDDLAIRGDQTPTASTPNGLSDLTTMEDYERFAVQQALAQCDGNRRQAARRLEVSEATLYRKIKSFGLEDA